MPDVNFIEQINTLSGQTVQLCYHCHKCTAGCPVAGEMEYGPDRLLRMVQMGEKEKLLTTRDIWLCVGCETCGTRCPNDIDIAPVTASLREMAYREGARVADPDAVKFHRLFLGIIQNMGRMHEASLLGLYKLWSLHILADLDSGAKMIMRGKIPIIPKPFKGRQEMKKLYEVANRVREAGIHDD